MNSGKRLILIGEIHGTTEMPWFLHHLACAYLQQGQTVRVGIEFPQREQTHIDAFMQSGGADRSLLFQGRTWTSNFQFGVSSVAMADVLQSLAEMKAEGYPVEVHAVVPPKLDSDESWDTPRARYIRANVMGRGPGEIGVVLMGNAHTRWPSKDAIYPALTVAYYFTREEAAVLEMRYTGGSAWICLNDLPCGVRQGRESPLPGEEPPLFTLMPKPPDSYADADVFVGRVTASVPAVARSE